MALQDIQRARPFLPQHQLIIVSGLPQGRSRWHSSEETILKLTAKSSQQLKFKAFMPWGEGGWEVLDSIALSPS
jgi:hypothetical protein